jgi:catechol 2,3-dioxygenase-like lactoylglutathione lyase family enzyme
VKLLYDHVCLTVADVDRSVEFYCRHFDFKPARRDNPVSGSSVEQLTSIVGAKLQAAFVTSDDLVLEFIQFIDKQSDLPVAAPNQIGALHLGFVVEDVRKAYEELSAQGVHFYSEPVYHARRGNYSVMATDPDGIPIELREQRALQTMPN